VRLLGVTLAVDEIPPVTDASSASVVYFDDRHFRHCWRFSMALDRQTLNQTTISFLKVLRSRITGHL